MTYELAKQLKDAGFPQSGSGIDSDTLDSAGNSGVNVYREKVYYPTLSELIAACGENIGSITRNSYGGWTAYREREIKDIMLWVDGKTPEEAVAKLWLLNANKR